VDEKVKEVTYPFSKGLALDNDFAVFLLVTRTPVP
jgi:hypothetical protein